MDKYDTHSFFLHYKKKYYKVSGESLIYVLRQLTRTLSAFHYCCCQKDDCLTIVRDSHTMSDKCFKDEYTTQHNKQGEPTHFKVGDDQQDRRYHITSKGKIFAPADALVSLSAPNRQGIIDRIIYDRARVNMEYRERRLKEQEDQERQGLGDTERQPRPRDSEVGRKWLEDLVKDILAWMLVNYDPKTDMFTVSKSAPDTKEGIMNLTEAQRSPLVIKALTAAMAGSDEKG